MESLACLVIISNCLTVGLAIFPSHSLFLHKFQWQNGLLSTVPLLEWLYLSCSESPMCTGKLEFWPYKCFVQSPILLLTLDSLTGVVLKVPRPYIYLPLMWLFQYVEITSFCYQSQPPDRVRFHRISPQNTYSCFGGSLLAVKHMILHFKELNSIFHFCCQMNPLICTGRL